MKPIITIGLACGLFVLWFTWWAATSKSTGPGETRRQAIVEAWTSLVIGFAINYGMNMLVIPLMTNGCPSTHEGNFWGGWIYTAASIVRQFFVRRGFNWLHHRGSF